jgi:hypothetical protein
MIVRAMLIIKPPENQKHHVIVVIRNGFMLCRVNPEHLAKIVPLTLVMQVVTDHNSAVSSRVIIGM